MKNFINNWNFKKHIAVEIMCYASVALVGNAFFSKSSDNDRDDRCLVKTCRNMTKKQKCFNRVLLGCFAVDLTASYFVLKGLKKLVK